MSQENLYALVVVTALILILILIGAVVTEIALLYFHVRRWMDRLSQELDHHRPYNYDPLNDEDPWPTDAWPTHLPHPKPGKNR